MSREPVDLRLPVLAGGVYLLGEYGHRAGLSSWRVALLAVVAVPVWLWSRRSHGDGSYARVLTVAAAAVPLWLAAAASTGILNVWVLAGYAAGAVGLGVAGWRSDVMRARRDARERAVEWARFAGDLGLAGSGLREITKTRLGWVRKIDVRGTARTAPDWVRSDLGVRWAARKSLPRARVLIREDSAHAGQILVEERLRDPWRETNVHPALCAESEWQLPERRSIGDGPVEVGADPTTGALLTLPLYGAEGAKQAMVVAGTGGGKTTLVNCILERVTACDDALVWAIDVAKGTLPSVWADALDWGAGVGERAGAVRMLRAAKVIIEERSRASSGRNHRATYKAPYLLIVVDEAGELMSSDAGRDLVGYINTKGRSAGVSIVFISQRGALAHAGTMDIKASAGIRVALSVTQASEMGHVVPDWQEIGAPDMSRYGEGRPGVALVVVRGEWAAGRVWDMSDLDAVEGLARRRGGPLGRLEPAIVERLGEAYANRRAPALVAVAAGPSERAVMTERAYDPVAEAKRITAGAVAEVADLQVPPGQAVGLSALVAARDAELAVNRATNVPGPVASAVLFPLAQMGVEGMSRAELVGALAGLGLSESSVKRHLRVMVDKGLIVRRGQTSCARYVLPEFAAEGGSMTA